MRHGRGRGRGGGVPIVVIIAVLIVIYYLSRWKYISYDIRYDRLTGTTEMRMVRAEEKIDWVEMPNYRYGKPLK